MDLLRSLPAGDVPEGAVRLGEQGCVVGRKVARFDLRSLFDITVTRVRSPSTFYFQLNSSLTELEELMDSLNRFYSSPGLPRSWTLPPFMAGLKGKPR